MSKDKCFIETYGCQMNKADSERMHGVLATIGYEPTENIDEANLLLMNTCTIREGAGDRAMSNIGRWTKYKEANPDVLIGLGGCMSQEKGADVQKRLPHIDIVFGTHNIQSLPELVTKAKTTRERQCELFESLPEDIPEIPIIRQTTVSAWVNVIYGCNFNCTYCIVPQVRGREKSRTQDIIKDEIKKLAEEGHKEITLLGQNVTAYGLDFDDPEVNLASLMRYIHDVEGIERIRFMTGHPHHVSDDLINTVSELPKVCNSWHLPIQSGNDNMLRRMARVYTSGSYLEMVDKIRAKVPNAYITSDIIVGFPGETEEEFQGSCEIIKQVEFASCMTAMYSPRRNTPGARWEQDPSLKIPDEEKYRRLQHINKIVTQTASDYCNKVYTDTEQKILIESEADKLENTWAGRTEGGKLCYIPKAVNESIGSIVTVKVNEVNPWTLRGVIV